MHTEKPTQTSQTETQKTDSTSQAKTNIHTNGKVQTGTFVNGPAQDTSSAGSKPKQ